MKAAFQRIKSWMNAHGAEVLVNNLAPGVTSAELDAFETRIGFKLPTDLRDLWAIHGGQRDEQDGFVGAMDLLTPDGGWGERENVAMFLGFQREAPELAEESRVTQEELESDAWLAFAGRGYADLLVVSCVSGRVYTCEKDSPPLHLIAESVGDWLHAYADRVEGGEYVVEEGFGTCYLACDSAMF